jgi:hypothetical protein
MKSAAAIIRWAWIRDIPNSSSHKFRDRIVFAGG